MNMGLGMGDRDRDKKRKGPRGPKDWVPGKKPRQIHTLEWGQDLDGATAIWVRGRTRDREEWVWQKATDKEDREIESHDPADRIGGPYTLYAFIDERSGTRMFIFAVVDSHFPAYDLVRADNESDATEAYLDWAADHRNLKIEEEDLKDYDERQRENLSYTSNGVPVDTDNLVSREVEFVRAEGVEAEPE